MCDTYRYIDILKFSFNIVIQYWLLGVSIHWCGPFSKHDLSNFIPKSNYKKLVCITLIDFFYHFLTNTTKQDIYLHFISVSILFRDTVSYRDIFSSDMQYYYLVISHIPIVYCDLYHCLVRQKYMNTYKLVFVNLMNSTVTEHSLANGSGMTDVNRTKLCQVS